MPLTAWAALLGTFAVAVVVPGPDVFLIMRLGVRERRPAVLSALGIMTGNFIWTGASVLGLATLMRALPGALPIMQLLGSLVLTWIGIQSIRGGLAGLRAARAARAQRAAQSEVDPVDTSLVTTSITKHPFRLGLITNLSNPKALLFFTALFSQLMPPDATAFDRVLIVVALSLLGLVWFVSFAFLTSSRGFQRWFGKATPVFDLAAGVVFLLVAGFMLVELAIHAFA